MNPLEPNDPLWKLLGQSRDVETRSNFAQNVARLARNTPQQRSWWSRVRAWWVESESPLPMRGLMAAAAVVTLAGWAAVSFLNEGASVSNAHSVVAPSPALTTPAPASPPVAQGVEVPLVAEVETQLESLDYLDALLALEDTSSLTDKEIAYLLY